MTNYEVRSPDQYITNFWTKTRAEAIEIVKSLSEERGEVLSIWEGEQKTAFTQYQNGKEYN